MISWHHLARMGYLGGAKKSISTVSGNSTFVHMTIMKSISKLRDTSNIGHIFHEYHISHMRYLHISILRNHENLKLQSRWILLRGLRKEEMGCRTGLQERWLWVRKYTWRNMRVCLFVCLSLCLFVCLSVCLSVYQ